VSQISDRSTGTVEAVVTGAQHSDRAEFLATWLQ